MNDDIKLRLQQAIDKQRVAAYEPHELVQLCQDTLRVIVCLETQLDTPQGSRLEEFATRIEKASSHFVDISKGLDFDNALAGALRAITASELTKDWRGHLQLNLATQIARAQTGRDEQG